MFNFAADFDVSYETLKTTIANLDVSKEAKYDHGYSWPLFKKWFAARLTTTIDAANVDIIAFLNSTAVNRSPPRFSTMITAFIKAKFSEKFLCDYDDEFDGILLFFALNRDYGILANFDRIKLLKDFLFNLKSIVGNAKMFKQQMLVMTHYFPELIKLGSSMALFTLSDPEIGRFLRTNELSKKSDETIEKLTAMPYGEVLRDIKQLRREGIVAPMNNSSNGNNINEIQLAEENSEESFVVMAKVRCFKCKKWGHFSRNCPTRNNGKLQEVQLVEVPLDAEIIVTNEDAKEELYFVDLELLEGGNKSEDKLENNFNLEAMVKPEVITSKSETCADVDLKETSIDNLCCKNGDLAVISEVTSSEELVSSFKDLSITNKEHCSPEEIFLLFEHLDTEFVVDTGASIHVTNDKALLSNVRNGSTLIKGVNGVSTTTIEGDIKLGKLYLKHVQYMPEAPRNLISVRRLTKEGYDANVDHEKFVISKGKLVVCTALPKSNHWMLTPNDVLQEMVFLTDSEMNKESILQQHLNLGHASKKQLQSILGKTVSDSTISEALKECQTCASVVPKTHIRKQPKQEFEVGEMICADMIGPINDAYGLIISDRKSKFAIGRVLQSKSEVSSKTLEILKTFKNLLTLTKRTIVMFRADNEFDTKMVGSFCDEEGITLQFSAPHSSYQNGFAETQNREIERKLKLMLIDSNVPSSYWNFAFHHSIFINNYVPRNNNTLSAWEIFRDCKKPISNILPFGCRIYAFNHDTRQKITKRDITGVFLGYHKSTKIAFVLEDSTDRIIRSSSFTGMNSVFPLVQSNESSSSTSPMVAISGPSSSPELSGINNTSSDASTFTINGDDDTIMKEAVVESSGESDVDISSGNTTDAEQTEITTSTPLPDMNPILKSNSGTATKMLVQRTKDSDTLILKPVVTPISRLRNQIIKRRLSDSPDPLNLLVPSKVQKALRQRIVIKPRAAIDLARKETGQIEDGNMSSRKLLEYFPSDNSDSEEINLLVNKNKYDIPTSFEEAILTPQKAKWLAACLEELMAMKSNDVYDIVPTSSIKDKTVKGRWVFAVKNEPTGERFKARLVAKGFSQIKGENFVDVYAPVMSFDTLRFVLAIAAIKKWSIAQLDAKNAFLNGPIDYDVYFQPPSGCDTPKDHCWKLKRGLYGLKQAPQIWFNTMASVLKSCGYEQSVLEPCLFYQHDLLLVVYVDDILITGKNEEVINKTKQLLQQKFVMKDLGHPSVFLGITIKETADGVKLSLSDFITKLENDYGINKERTLLTPLVKGFNAAETTTRVLTEDEHLKYRSIIGCLLFVANTVRLDISFATSLLSRYLVSPRIIHLKAAYRVLQYIVQTKDFSLDYSPNSQLVKFKDFRYLDKTKSVKINDYGMEGPFCVTVLSDSDYAADLGDRHSQSGSCTFLNNNLISWSSKKQNCVALSSTESEYVAMTESAKSGLYFKNLLKEINMTTTYINMCGDNLSALTLSAHKTVHQKTKHIDVKYHFL